MLHDSDNRTLCYSITDGGLKHRFFGTQATINPKKNQIVVQNLPGDVSLYDLSTGERQHRLSFGSPATFLRFSLDGKRLFVLSEAQVAYAFDLEKLETKPLAASTAPAS